MLQDSDSQEWIKRTKERIYVPESDVEVVAKLFLGHLTPPADLGQLAVLLVHHAQLLLVALTQVRQH